MRVGREKPQQQPTRKTVLLKSIISKPVKIAHFLKKREECNSYKPLYICRNAFDISVLLVHELLRRVALDSYELHLHIPVLLDDTSPKVDNFII